MWVDPRQVMSRCQLDNQGVIAVGDGGWAYDQPTLRIAGKRCDGVLDFAGIVNTSFTYFDREGRSGGLGGAQHGDIAGERRWARHALKNLSGPKCRNGAQFGVLRIDARKIAVYCYGL